MTTQVLTLGERLTVARKRAGLSQSELGRQLGLSRPSISHYENDDRAPDFAVVARWALATGTDLGWFAEAATGRDTATTWSNASYHPDQMSLWTYGTPEAA